MTPSTSLPTMLSLRESLALVCGDVSPLETESVSLGSALGRVLARDAIAPAAVPPWDNSSMDGYAVRASDIMGASEGAPVRLPIIATIAAGDHPTGPLAAGTAVRITTGAPVPPGCDTVVRVEDTDYAPDPNGTEVVAIRSSRDAQKNIRARGEDVNEGDTVLHAGAGIFSAQIGALAATGHQHVHVHRMPRVAIIHSGNELVTLDRYDEVLAGKKIVSSNSYALPALIQSAGGQPIDIGIAEDTPDALRRSLERARDCDLILTTGGMALGIADHTRAVLANMKADIRFWRVRIKPGSQMAYGRVNEVPWLGLPGNPVSTLVVGEIFVRPVIRRMLGHRAVFRSPITLTLSQHFRTPGKLAHLLRVVATRNGNSAFAARLSGGQGSAILSSTAAANALMIIPEDREEANVGDSFPGLLLGDDALHTAEWSL